jgi:hypothetical protein
MNQRRPRDLPIYAVSIAEAARIAHLSRAEIEKRIKAGKIFAQRTDGGGKTVVGLYSLHQHLNGTTNSETDVIGVD